MIKMAFLSLMTGLIASSSVYGIDTCRALEAKVTVSQKTDVYFKEKLGSVEEHSLREGQTFAHIYYDSTQDPYVFVGFPAGNSGVALWMKTPSGKANLEAIAAPRALQRPQGLNGLEVETKTGTTKLTIADSLLGSMRFIRDRELGIAAPKVVSNQTIRLVDGRLKMTRTSLNGLASYLLEVEPIGDTRLRKTHGLWTLDSPTEVQFVLRAFTGEPPLTPMSLDEIFKPEALKNMSAKKLREFSFLLTKEKLMAGSPRYFSKFGRDSIYTLRVLMSVMKPAAIEALLSATLSSMDPSHGWVSHEQHEGDFASYERMRHGENYKGVNTPIEDYKMIDDDFAFVVTLGEFMKRYPDRVRSFLDGIEQRGLQRRALVKTLFRNVIQETTSFSQKPTYQNLIGLKGHEKTGQWRDSENGLGGGKYPFDVNAALVPGALKALADLTSQPSSEFYNLNLSEKLNHSFTVWNTQVVPLFNVKISQAEAAKMGEDYLRSLGIGEKVATPTEDIIFPAISIDENGQPVPIMHSDDSMMMTFGYPTEEYLRGVSKRVEGAFPYGLATPVGILVANPVFASRELQNKFGETKYHGRVSWTMQEDLLAFGFGRQLLRSDLSAEDRDAMMRSQAAIEKVVASKASMGGTEVFSILYVNGHFVATPFKGDAKSNSNQLWSHLRLGFTP